MKIYSETALRNFNFWSYAKENVKNLTSEQLDEVEAILDELYPEGVDETFVNDLFWHDFDTVIDWLGIEEDEDEEDEDEEDEDEE